MSSFAVTLESLMKEEGLNQSGLSNSSGVGQGLISGYLNDDRLPEDDMLTKLVRAFNRDAGNALLAAWLRDKIPEELKGRVDVSPKNGAGRVMETPAGPPGYKHLPPRIRTVVNKVTAAVGSDPKFLRAIQTTLDLRD